MTSFIVEGALTSAEYDAFRARGIARLNAFYRTQHQAGEPIAISIAFVSLANTVIAMLVHAKTAQAVISRDGGLLFMAVFGLTIATHFAAMHAMRYASRRFQRALTSACRRDPPFPLAARRYQLDKAGVRVSNPDIETFFAWRALSGAEEAQGLLLFWAGHVHGFGIPVRLFSGPESARAALAYAHERISARPA